MYNLKLNNPNQIHVNTKDSFYQELLAFLHIDFEKFSGSVKNGDKYDCFINNFLEKLYLKNIPIEKAKVLLQRYRYSYFFEAK